MTNDKSINATVEVRVKYSIITPVYNRADCIGRCIESVIRNILHNEEFEHIIIDDGSSDKTAEIIKKYSDQYPHIKFIRFIDNHGTNAARNAAIKIAKGEFCIILDSDDYFVDDAIRIISDTINLKPDYKHYLFVPNDMQSKYAQNYLLRGREERTISFVDFLSGSFNGDYIHVINADILKMYPFDESLRIYEGVFFLRFYQEAKRMLFTNKIVTIRERSREDSVTREVFRTSFTVIRRTIKATELNVEWFKHDYESLGIYDALYRQYQILIDNYLLLNCYCKAKSYMDTLSECNGSVSMFHTLIYLFRCGWLYRCCLKWYLMLKYKLLNVKIG